VVASPGWKKLGQCFFNVFQWFWCVDIKNKKNMTKLFWFIFKQKIQCTTISIICVFDIVVAFAVAVLKMRFKKSYKL